jgi:hypothetical protein
MDLMSSSEFPRSESKAAHRATFEETYPRYDFPELVRLALAMGAWLAKVRRRLEGRRPDVSGRPVPGDINPAE